MYSGMIPSWVRTMIVTMTLTYRAGRPAKRSRANAKPASVERSTTLNVMVEATITELTSARPDAPGTAGCRLGLGSTEIQGGGHQALRMRRTMRKLTAAATTITRNISQAVAEAKPKSYRPKPASYMYNASVWN